MRKLFVLTLLISLSSCAGIKPINKSVSNNSPDSVAINDEAEILSEEDIKPREETVRLGSNGGDVYHAFEENDFDNQQIVKKINVGLNLGPGLYRSVQYINLLKFLEKEQLAPKVIAGTEFGAIISAMYASGMTPEMIEWTFFKYFKEKSNAAIYTSTWIKEIENLLLSQIKMTHVEDAKIKFYITLKDPINNKTYFFDKGNVIDLLKQNLMLKKEKSLFGAENKYVSAITTEVFNPKLLKKMGADFLISADILNKNFKLAEVSKDITVEYSKSLKKISELRSQFDYNYILGKEGIIINSNQDAPKYGIDVNKYISTSKNSLKLKIHNKYLKDNQED